LRSSGKGGQLRHSNRQNDAWSL